VFCEKNRPSLRNTRQHTENYYTENLYPREAVKKAWELAAEEPDEEIRALVEEKRQWQLAKERCGGVIESVVPISEDLDHSGMDHEPGNPENHLWAV
jgi:hypothetical protein